jgi:predicted nucleotidyltransferase
LGIRVAFVFGSLAREDATAGSDIDLLVVGDLSMRDLVRRLAPVSDEAEREINPVLLSETEFTRRSRQREAFLARVMNSPKLFIVGAEDDLRELG